jgi:hypothetical protein
LPILAAISGLAMGRVFETGAVTQDVLISLVNAIVFEEQQVRDGIWLNP